MEELALLGCGLLVMFVILAKILVTLSFDARSIKFLKVATCIFFNSGVLLLVIYVCCKIIEKGRLG